MPSLGPNMIINSALDSTDDLILQPGVTVDTANGELDYAAPSNRPMANCIFGLNAAFEEGKSYLFGCEMLSVNADGYYAMFAGAGSIPNIASVGSHSAVYVCADDSEQVVRIYGVGGWRATTGSISGPFVCEIIPD